MTNIFIRYFQHLLPLPIKLNQDQIQY